MPTNRDSICLTKESNAHDMSKDSIGGNVRVDDDNEPPAPAPGSRPASPDPLGIKAFDKPYNPEIIITTLLSETYY